MGGMRGGDKRGMAEKWLQIHHDLNVYGPGQWNGGGKINERERETASSQMSKSQARNYEKYRTGDEREESYHFIYISDDGTLRSFVLTFVSLYS